jgi:2-keto-4-pentenoate hydratase
MAVSSAKDFDPRALAARLHSLQKTGKTAPTSDFALPATLQEAMDAQNFLVAEERISTHAWKVTVSPDGQAVTAPLSPYVEASSGAAIAWRQGIKFEAEVAVRLGKDLPVRIDGSYTREDLAEAISEVYLGAELLVSSVAESGSVSFLLFLADRLGNRGYVLGPVLPKSTIDTIMDMPLSVRFNGQSIYDGTARHPKGDVLSWLLDYANDRLRPHTSLKGGSLITTGTLCGAIELTAPGPIEILLDGKVRLNLTVA